MGVESAVKSGQLQHYIIILGHYTQTKSSQQEYWTLIIKHQTFLSRKYSEGIVMFEQSCILRC